MKIRPENKLDRLKWNLIGIAGKFLVDVLFYFSRIELIGFEKLRHIASTRQLILAFWHSRILLISYMHQGEKAGIQVSRSADGEIIARILERQGQKTIRGSSSRGGLRALAQLIKYMKVEKKPGVIIPDGPRGPRFKAQSGVIALAKKTGFPIIPVSYSARKIKVFNSWDRFILPYPFTTCRVVYGQPVYVAQDADKAEEESCRLRLEQELCQITFQADHFFGHKID